MFSAANICWLKIFYRQIIWEVGKEDGSLLSNKENRYGCRWVETEMHTPLGAGRVKCELEMEKARLEMIQIGTREWSTLHTNRSKSCLDLEMGQKPRWRQKKRVIRGKHFNFIPVPGGESNEPMSTRWRRGTYISENVSIESTMPMIIVRAWYQHPYRMRVRDTKQS